MNQDTFRSFLTTPRPGAAVSSARPSSGSGAVLGGGAGAAPKRGYNPYTNKPATHESKKQDAVKKKQTKKDGKYVDRAAARRQGLDNEYTDVLAMRDDFERRQEGDDAADIEEKRQLLGGDAEHSILVKGLDLALLARNKAELEANQAEDDDDVLEAAFGAGPSTAAPAIAADDEAASKKRSRDEILAAVQSKRRALAGAKPAPAPVPVPELNRSKFKPIGFKDDKKASAKTAVGRDGQVKKLKKKKKKVAEDATAPAFVVPVAPANADASPVVADVPAPSPSPPSPPAPAIAAPSAAPVEKRFAKPLVAANLSDDDDIFGGVGDYEADAGSDSDEDAPRASTSAQPTEKDTAPPVEVNWFRTGRTPSPPPTAASPKGKERATSVLAGAHAEAADDDGEAAGRNLSRSPSPEPVTRLVPLSGTSAREMLARAEAAEQAAQRRSNKAKWRQSQGLAKQAGDDEEDDEDESARGSWRGKQKEGADDKKRLNHEYQQYQNYLKKLDK